MHPNRSIRCEALRLAGAMCLAVTFFSRVAAADRPPADADNPAYTWDLTELYPTPEAWTEARDKLLAKVDTLDKSAGTLGRSAGDTLAALSAISSAKKEAARLGVYASLKGDENVKIAVNQERIQAAQALNTLSAKKPPG